jgi:ABC-2 type transport system permease protein
MRELLVVLNTRAQSILKRAFEMRWRTVAQNSASVLIFGGFTLAVFFVSRYVTSYLLTEAHIGLFLFHRFLSMMLYVFFVTVNVGNMVVAFSTLYRSEEVGFLMTLPISHAKIFLIKFVDNFFYSSSTLTLIGLAILLGYGSVFNLPWYFYFFTMFFVLLPFLLIAGILAITSLMLLIKLGTRIGFKVLLLLITTVYIGTVYAYFTVTNPMQLVGDVMKVWPKVDEYLGYLDPPFVQALPNHWVAEFLYWSLIGDASRALPYFFMLFLTMLGLIVLAALMARRFYYESWLAVADLQAGSRTQDGSRRSLFDFHTGLLRPRWSAFFKRDVTMFLREPSQWLHLMLMFLLLGVFLVSLTSLSGTFDQPEIQTVAFVVIFMFQGFLIASIALRFVFPIVSMEGDAFWCVRASPVRLGKLYWYKNVFAFAAILIIAETLSVATISFFRRDIVLVAVVAVAFLFVSLTLVGLNIGAGGYFAMYKEKNPVRVASSQGASLTFLASMAYLTLVAIIMIVPLSNYFVGALNSQATSMQWAVMPLAIVATISLIIFAASAGFGLRAIRRSV